MVKLSQKNNNTDNKYNKYIPKVMLQEDLLWQHQLFAFVFPFPNQDEKDQSRYEFELSQEPEKILNKIITYLRLQIMFIHEFLSKPIANES